MPFGTCGDNTESKISEISCASVSVQRAKIACRLEAPVGATEVVLQMSLRVDDPEPIRCRSSRCES